MAATFIDLQSASVKELKQQLQPLCSAVQIEACVEKRDLIELLTSVSPLMSASSWDWGSGYVAKATFSQAKAKKHPTAPPEPPSLEQSKGADMMRKMGWKNGQGLGKNEEGRTAPIAVSTQKQRRGLGAQDLPEEKVPKPSPAPWTDEDDLPTMFDPLVHPPEDAPPPPKLQKSKFQQQDSSISKKARLENQLKSNKAPHIKDIVRFG